LLLDQTGDRLPRREAGGMLKRRRKIGEGSCRRELRQLPGPERRLSIGHTSPRSGAVGDLTSGIHVASQAGFRAMPRRNAKNQAEHLKSGRTPQALPLTSMAQAIGMKISPNTSGFTSYLNGAGDRNEAKGKA
jgi:hypothetical protein